MEGGAKKTVKTKKELLEEVLEEATATLVRAKVNKDFYNWLVKEAPNDQKVVQAKSNNEILLIRQEKLVSILKEHIKENE